jgi:hypothetical protein
MSKVVKINIDELLRVLQEARKKGEFVDLEVDALDNTLKVSLNLNEAPKEEDTEIDFDKDANNLIG